MAGHSQFKNIMHRKGKQDAKRGKVFTKMIRDGKGIEPLSVEEETAVERALGGT